MRGMLRASRQGFFRRGYELESDGVPVTTLDGTRREGCVFTLAGAEYRVERDTRKRFVLRGPDHDAATAERTTGREWTVTTPSGGLTLARPSRWRSVWEVRVRGEVLGTIRHEGVFRRSFVADMPSEVPAPVGVFAFYVVLVNYEREQNAAAGAAG